MSKLAIIDLGSNTCRLVIFAVSPEGAFRLTDQVSETVRIGANMFASGMLQPEPMRRAVQLLKMYAGLCAANQIEHVIATATSAVRDARNGQEFVARVHDETGLALRVLTGTAEAHYAYLGAINGTTMCDGIIADLGGGSLELMQARDRLPTAMTSLPLGAVRMVEQFLRADPISKSAAKEAAAYCDKQLDAFTRAKLTRGETLIALGGTARALAKIDQRRRRYPIERLDAYELSRAAVEEITDDLLKKDLAARLKIKGLKDERADIIPGGALVIRQLMRHLDADALVVSGRGLREGLLYEFLLNETFSGARGESFFQTAKIPHAGEPHSVLADVRAFGIANLSLLYQIEWAHAQHVCRLALELFDGLRALHGLGQNERALLAYAAILHDSGVLIDYYRHHHHSAYLIENADLPGFTHREIALLALLVRWHRRGEPTLEPYEALCRKGDAALLEKLVACLRLAEDLERSRAQLVRHVQCQTDKQEIRILAQTRQTADAELWAANRETALWQKAYGRAMRVLLAPESSAEPSAPAGEKTLAERAARISTMARA
jgi:exopolyphosphatase/guanosine-5'-triphosphate,3'-diphosphate pyrophosphatase